MITLIPYGADMNQFTKDELGSIYLDMNHNILKYGKDNIAPEYLAFRDKVEKMIDNYCEHNNDPRFNAMPCAGAPKLCTKCNEFYL